MTDDDPDRAGRWWQAVEDEVAKRSSDDELPDPWADSVPDAPGLTDDQRDLLGGLDDQPGVARLTRSDLARLGDGATGDESP